MIINILCSGPAGKGINFISSFVSYTFAKAGYYVFSSREYESRVRGGNNYNLISISDFPIRSNLSKFDVLIALDKKSVLIHKERMKKDFFLVREEDNLKAAACLFKMFSLPILEFKESLKRFNVSFSSEIERSFNEENRKIISLKLRKSHIKTFSGNKSLAGGMIDGGMKFYYAYPMTPATGLLNEVVAAKSSCFGIEMESEIAAANAAVGSSICGEISVVGTSGGGFDLMIETLSLAGMARIPVVFYLAQRAGPSTGAPTLTSQGDLSDALYSGHGEFARIVMAVGDGEDCIQMPSELFHLTQEFMVPGILLSDKHVVESVYSFDRDFLVKKVYSKIKWPSRFNSYESDSRKISDDSVKNMIKNAKERVGLFKKIEKSIKRPFAFYGKKGKNLIVSWGSTKGAILDAIKEINCGFMQIRYLAPFSRKIEKEIAKAENLIVVENNATSPLSSLIQEKTGIVIKEKNKILKFDGRPFFSDELRKEIIRRLL